MFVVYPRILAAINSGSSAGEIAIATSFGASTTPKLRRGCMRLLASSRSARTDRGLTVTRRGSSHQVEQLIRETER